MKRSKSYELELLEAKFELAKIKYEITKYYDKGIKRND